MDTESVYNVSQLRLLSDVSANPMRILRFLALVVYKLRAKLQTGWHKVFGLEGKLGEFTVLSYNLAHYLDLLLLNTILRCVELDVSLKGFLQQNLVLTIVYPHQDLEWELFKRWYVISEVAGVFVNGDPNVESVRLNHAVKLVYV